MVKAILGATGAVGRSLAARLVRDGEPFRVVGRSLDRLREYFADYEPLVEYCEADLTDPADAARATAGVHTAFYTVGVPYDKFALHPQMTTVVLKAAAASGVRSFLHVSNIYPYGRAGTNPVDENHPRNPVAVKGRMRKLQEDLVLAAHDAGGMRTTIVRPPDYAGAFPGSMVGSAFESAPKGGTAMLLAPIDLEHEYIFVPDLADAIVLLASKDEAYGRAWNVGGSGKITTRRFAEMVYEACGTKPRFMQINLFTLRVMGLFSPVMRELVEMHYLQTEPLILDDSRLRALLPEWKKTSYEDGIAAIVEQSCKPAPLSS